MHIIHIWLVKDNGNGFFLSLFEALVIHQKIRLAHIYYYCNVKYYGYNDDGAKNIFKIIIYTPNRTVGKVQYK